MAFQATLLVLVVSIRTAEAWQVTALVGVAALTASYRAAPSRRLSAIWPAATTLAILATYMVYQNNVFPQEYFSRNVRTKVGWHNVLMGFALHPGMAEWYGLRIDDQSIVDYVKKKAGQDPSLARDEIFWGPKDKPDGAVKNFREYDRLCRMAVLGLVTAHPWQTLKLFVWYKPRLLVRSFEYAVVRLPRDLRYYELHDQAPSLLTPRDREALHAFFNPLSPIPLLLLLAGLLAAGVKGATHAFDSGALATLTVTAGASLLPAFLTYPVIHVIAGVFWASPLIFYALAIRFGGELATVVQRSWHEHGDGARAEEVQAVDRSGAGVDSPR